MKSKPCTHVVQRVGVGLYKAVTPRSWQGHLKVTARSHQSQINTKVLNKAYFCCFCSNFVHLRCPWWLKPSRTPTWMYTKHTQEVTGVFLCWRGHTRQIMFMSSLSEMGQITKWWPCLDQWSILQFHVKKSNQSTHGDMGFGCTFEGCYLKAMARSSQGHSMSNQHKRGGNSIIELFLLHFCTLEMPKK